MPDVAFDFYSSDQWAGNLAGQSYDDLTLDPDSSAVTIDVPSGVLTLAADGPSTNTTNVPSGVLTLAADGPAVAVQAAIASGALTLAGDGPTLAFRIHVGSGVITLTADGPVITRAELPVTDITRDGVVASATDSDHAHGMFVAANDGRIFVQVVSTDAGPQTVAFVITETVDGERANPKTVAVPAGATRWVGPFPEDFYNQNDEAIWLNPSIDGSLKLRAYRLPREAVILSE